MRIFTVLNLAAILCCITSAKRKPSSALHPFLYYNEGDIPRMRKQAKTTHSHIAARIAKVVRTIKTFSDKNIPPSDWNVFSSKWNENYGNNLCGLAIYCVLNDEDTQAREMIFQSMDVFTALPNWRVKASLRDDVPVAHALNGMATAYDFLYPYMNKHQREKYLDKIAKVSLEMYEKSVSKSVWWSKCYIQNHVATNFAALLTAALVVSRHERYSKNATKWKLKAHQMLFKTMHVLKYVVDGSLNEGVSYGSYTTRSITQYVYLALRHLKTDLTKNIWLQEHYWFMYYTTMHGFKDTIGIADSGPGWFYGPESQLYFLDRFVLKNGYANWLATKIQNSEFVSTNNGITSTIHTEFIFYNASILPKAPPDYHEEQLHTFSDWGVVVYRRGLSTWESSHGYMDKSAVFLSFKCGVLHGQAVNQMVIGKPPVPWIRGWKSFNPGHEHVDQGSFVFAPYGIPFITETYYGPKYTWLNNAILFGPSDNSPCSEPLEGQIGECLKWFNYTSMDPWRARGTIVTSLTEDGLVLTCGEMSTWYRKELGLASVYRCLVLLSQGALLVVDHIEKKPDSVVQYMNTFFHNVNNAFYTEECWEKNRHACAGMSIEGKTFRAVWVNSHGSKSTVEVGDKNFFLQMKKVKTSYLNITTPLYNKYTRTAYLFTGPGNDIRSLRINSAQDHGVYISVVINDLRYTVALVTKHGLPNVRYRWLGFGGYGKVNIEKRRSTNVESNGGFVQSKVIQFGVGVFNSTLRRPTKRIRLVPPDNGNSVFILFISAAVVCTMLLVYFQLTRVVQLQMSIKCIVLCLVVIYGVLSLADFLRGCSQRGTGCLWNPTVIHQRDFYGFLGATRHQKPPFVVYTSLPFAGSELLGELFKANTDFFQFELPNHYFHQSSLINISHRRSIFSNEPIDLCSAFQIRQSERESAPISQWFRGFLSNPKALGPSFPQRSQTSLPAIGLKDPGWALRFHWLRRVLGVRMKAIVVVRDPRSWVNTWLSEFKSNPVLLRSTKEAIAMLEKTNCKEEKTEDFAQELKAVQGVLLASDKKRRELLGTKFLAQLWAAHTNAVLRMVRSVPKDQIRVFRLEDLLLRPKKTARRVYQFLSLSLPPIVDNRLQQVTRSRQFKFANTREKIGPDMVNSWRKSLSTNQIREIESICSLVMTQLRYNPI